MCMDLVKDLLAKLKLIHPEPAGYQPVANPLLSELLNWKTPYMSAIRIPEGPTFSCPFPTS